jgi:hypothetical protein
MLPLARTAGLRVEQVDDGLVVYEGSGDAGTRLNRTAALVWQNSDGHRTIAELAEVLGTELGEVANEDLVLTALDRLEELGLIESGYPRREVAAARMSRRRFIGRVGVASMAALVLPVVQRLGAPAVALAKPGKGQGQGWYYHYYYDTPPGYYQSYYNQPYYYPG